MLGKNLWAIFVLSHQHRPVSTCQSSTPFPGLVTSAHGTGSCDRPAPTVEGQRAQASRAVASLPPRAPCRILSRFAFLKPSYP